MSNRLRHVFSPERFSAAEGILGIMALVLLVWLFWPEASLPKLDQRVTWQQQLRETERLRSEELAAEQLAADQKAVETASATDRPEETALAVEPAPKRRALRKPSEFADRFERNDDGVTDRERVAAVASPPDRGGSSEAIRAVERLENSRPDGEVLASVDDQTTVLDKAINERQVAVTSSEALDTLSEPDEGFDAALANLPPEAEGFTIESEASAHVRRRPRDGAPSWLKNAVASSLIEDRPVIAVVIDDLGLNRAGTRVMNELPGPLTLAFLPYAGKIEAQTEAARAAGHELMVHMPMEPFGSQWPGPGALMTGLSHDEFVERLENSLNRIEGYVGVNNHMGSKLTSDRARMDLVMRTLRDRDVLFLDSKTSSRSVAGEMANRNGVPNTTRDVFLDHEIDLGKIRRQMALVERIARRTGSAVAIGHPHNATIEALRGWLPTLAARGFALAPISAVVARRACDDNLLIAAETCGRYLQVKKTDISTVTSVDG